MTKKKNLAWFFAFSCCVSLLLGLSGKAFAQSPLEGAWVLENTQDAKGNADTEPLPGLWLFTMNHYSMMFVTGDKPRALPDENNPSDAQLLKAYRSFTANSGRYELKGNQVIMHPYVAKSPNFMAGWPQTTITFSFVRDGDSLTVTDPDGEKFTFQNVDSSAPPWEQQ